MYNFDGKSHSLNNSSTDNSESGSPQSSSLRFWQSPPSSPESPPALSPSLQIKALNYYRKVVKPLLGDDPEIRKKAEEGYTLVGYKGTSIKKQDSFLGGISVTKADKWQPTTGAASKPGLYTTPHYDTAFEFAKLEVMEEAAATNPALREPLEKDYNFADARQKKKFDSDAIKWAERTSEFQTSSECHNHIAILRVYVQDFFNKKGLPHLQSTLPDDWEKYDYIEGVMPGGTSNQWEIKFNKIKKVYDDLQMTPSMKTDAGKDLPKGSAKMIEAFKSIPNDETSQKTSESEMTP